MADHTLEVQDYGHPWLIKLRGQIDVTCRQ